MTDMGDGVNSDALNQEGTLNGTLTFSFNCYC
jgi:hypothetical protein